MNRDKAFEAESGFLIEDGPFITGGAASPLGLDLPTDTIYLQTLTATGTLIWKKFNTGVNDWRIVSAIDVPFDNSGSSLLSTNTEAAIKEIDSVIQTSASPGFSYGKRSNVSPNTWLENESVPSNKSGRYVYITNAVISRIFVSNENISTFDVEVYSHDGDEINLTLLGTVSVISARGDDFSVSYSVPTGKQLGLKLVNGSARNNIAGLELQGTN